MKAFLALLVLLPALALPLAAASSLDPSAGPASDAAIPCYGDARAVLVCWTGTDPGCFYFTVLGERAYWLDFCY